MSQPSVASFFHSRKRTAVDDIFAAKNKLNAPDAVLPASPSSTVVEQSAPVAAKTHSDDGEPSIGPATRSGRRTPQPVLMTAASTRPRRASKTSDAKRTAAVAPAQQKIVKFTLAGHLSPKKLVQKREASNAAAGNVSVTLFGQRESANVEQRGQKTPTKAEQDARVSADRLADARSKMSLTEIRERVTRSNKLADLKASMAKMKALEAKREQIISTRKSTMKTADKHNNSDAQTDRAAKILGKSLKQFDKIELEILSSPQKGLTTPTKQRTEPASPGGGTDPLMSPKHSVTPRRLLFSPSKTAGGSPVSKLITPTSPSAALPAYQRFQSLRDAGRPTLTLPYKYRCLAETFKCLDTVCSMFFNRHETITMKKLRPAVQRMLRKNFGEHELGQIAAVYPGAYKFHQKKMLNAGSHTKYDYYQLVVVPNVPVDGSAPPPVKSDTINEDDIMRQQHCMNPQLIIERQHRFQQLLLDLVKAEHDKFLRSMDQPFVVPRDKITRWHLQFDLEACPDVQPAELPQPPNVEKFSSARDILSTARNLFNCATPSERLMQRVEEKLAERKAAASAAAGAAKKTVGSHQSAGTDTESEPPTPTSQTGQTTTGPEPVSALLKGVPKTLLERIRAKQAAKALDAMTRRPSQDKEAGKYERLPDVARYLRNIFVTESRNVLKIETVLAKLENSFRERMSKERMKELLELVAKEVPNQWLAFPHINDVHYVKIKKDVPLGDVMAVLERRAAEMA